MIETKIEGTDSLLEKLMKQANILQDINGKCPVCKTNLTDECKALAKELILHEYEDLLDEKTNLETQLITVRESHKSIMGNLQGYKLEDKRSGIKKAYVSVENLKGEISSLQTQNIDMNGIRDKIKENTSLLVEARKQESIYSDLAQAFGPKGIPLMIIDSVIEELQILINENIHSLSGLPISVELRTQRESVQGDMIDTFQIMITDGQHTRGYFNYSGGEKMIIDLSIRLGLSELLARRNNFKVETLIIDEGLGSLDDENQRNLINTLKKLESKFSNILVVTHTQAKDYFTNILELSKVNGISTLDKIGSMWYNTNRVEK